MISNKDLMHILIADDDEDDRTFLVGDGRTKKNT
jgi:hypothetical protein